MAGVDLYTISQLLGHANIEMAVRYAHLTPDHKKLAVEKLERQLAAATGIAESRQEIT